MYQVHFRNAENKVIVHTGHFIRNTLLPPQILAYRFGLGTGHDAFFAILGYVGQQLFPYVVVRVQCVHHLGRLESGSAHGIEETGKRSIGIKVIQPEYGLLSWHRLRIAVHVDILLPGSERDLSDNGLRHLGSILPTLHKQINPGQEGLACNIGNVVRIGNGIDLSTGGVILCHRLEQFHRFIQVIENLSINIFDRPAWKDFFERSHMRKDRDADMRVVSSIIIWLCVSATNLEHGKRPGEMRLCHNLSHHCFFGRRPPLLQISGAIFQEIRYLSNDRPPICPVVAGISSYMMLLHLIIEQQLVAFVSICRNIQQVSRNLGIFDICRIKTADFSMKPFAGTHVTVVFQHKTGNGVFSDDINRQQFLFQFLAGQQCCCSSRDQNRFY